MSKKHRFEFFVRWICKVDTSIFVFITKCLNLLIAFLIHLRRRKRLVREIHKYLFSGGKHNFYFFLCARSVFIGGCTEACPQNGNCGITVIYKLLIQQCLRFSPRLSIRVFMPVFCANTNSQSIRKLSIKLWYGVLNYTNLSCNISWARDEKIVLDYILGIYPPPFAVFSAL